MHNKSVTALADALASGKVSAEELARHFLTRIRRLDAKYNSVICVDEDRTLGEARAADQRRARGEAGRLDGIPFLHKDIFCTAGLRTSCASKMLDTFIPPYNATVVEKMAAAGMVTLGKTNMDEFAMGSSNETSYYGPTRNPWNLDCVCGGSSGGSAAAVAARLAPAATGTDTGGSIRQPAALCGLTGLKPTYGRISRYGIIAFASSLDQAGPMTRSAEDAALLLGVMSGFDQRDSTSIDEPVPDYVTALSTPLSGLRIGIPKEYFGQGLNPGTGQCVYAALAELERLGAQLIDIRLPNSPLSVPVYYVIAPAECSTNLARYDGVRYGHRCTDPVDLDDMYVRTRAEGFGDEVKRRILVGTYVLSAGYYDAYYNKAQQVRRLIKQDFVEAFAQVDVVVGPSSPSPAFPLGSKTDDPTEMYLEDIYTIAANLAGLPAMSVPVGLVDDKPVGLQLIGNYLDEARILNVAHQFQCATDWHLQAPPSID